MKFVRIAVMMKRAFSESYDIKLYARQPSEELSVKKYAAGNQKIIVDEER